MSDFPFSARTCQFSGTPIPSQLPIKTATSTVLSNQDLGDKETNAKYRLRASCVVTSKDFGQTHYTTFLKQEELPEPAAEAARAKVSQ